MATMVRPLRKDELATAASTLALAFDDDPLFRFFVPAPARRMATLRWFHQSALQECFAVGGAFTLVDGGPEAGALALLPPGAWPTPLHRTLRAVALPRALPTLRLIRAGLHLEHKIRALHPAQPHVYVYLLGVHPERKGQGKGATLLRHARAMSAEAGCVTHLETSNPVNLPFYKRFGLEVATEITSHGGPPVWTMTTRAGARVEDQRQRVPTGL